MSPKLKKTFTILCCCICFLQTGCISTKVQKDLTKPSQIEMAEMSEYISVQIPDNLTELIGKTYEDLMPSDDDVVEYLSARYLANEKEIEHITDEELKNEDIIHFSYVCYQKGTYIHDKSNPQEQVMTLGTANPLLPEDLQNILSDYLIGKNSSGSYELIVPASAEEKELSSDETQSEADVNHEAPDVSEAADSVYTISVKYKEGEDKYPDLKTYFQNNARLQIDWGTYETFFESGNLACLSKNKELIFYDILNAIADNSVFLKNHSLYTRGQAKALKRLYEETAKSYGITFSEYARSLGYDSENSFTARIQDDAEVLTKAKLVFFAYLQDQEIEIPEYNYSSYAVSKAGLWDFDGAADLVSVYGSDSIRFELLREVYQDTFLRLAIPDYPEEASETNDTASDSLIETEDTVSANDIDLSETETTGSDHDIDLSETEESVAEDISSDSTSE